MKVKYRAINVLTRGPRLAILVIFAVLFTAVAPPGSGRGLATGTSLTSLSDDRIPETVTFGENFDGVTLPAIPPGWSTATTGGNASFTTVAPTGANTTNSAFTNNPAAAGSAELVSPPIAIGEGPTRLSFRHIYLTEPTSGYDGGVLEMSIAGGAFQDITLAGGSFVHGGYVSQIGPSATGNPLIGRFAWTGVASEYLVTIVDLPAAAANQNVRFKWRYGTDVIVAGQGWWVDDVQIIIPTVGPGITHTFSNTSSIAIPVTGAANPYPSSITVSSVPTQMAKATVKLNSLSHATPSDLDILLVGPQGQTAVLMSDVGSTFDLVGVNLTIDSDAASPMPSNAAISSGTYLPTNSVVGDAFPAPAPVQTGSSTLTVFNGSNPNGEWRLFVVDDQSGEAGTIAGGWTLTITAAISGQNTAAITIPESGTASPYPSEVNVVDHINPVSRVLVNLTNFNHTSPDDVDILLVSPSGRSVVLMSDVGGSNPAANLNLSFDDTAAAELPDNGPLTSGLYRPTDFEPGDPFPAPAPPTGPPNGRLLSSLNGTVANGAWRLFIVDDAGNNAGAFSGGWNVLVGTTAGLISIAGSGPSTPYPSEFTVSGLPGNITKATVTIQNFSHIAPDDVDIMLVGPDNRRVVLMSDAGGSSEVGGVNLTFDDLAPNTIPDGGGLVSGTYKPGDYEPGEVFPPPAPAGPPTGTTLQAFYGGVPNGIWRLFAVNENGTTYGSIGGAWSVTLQTSVSACAVSINPTIQAFPVGGGAGGFNVLQPTGCSWSSSTTDPWITITSGSSGAGNGAIGFTVAQNQGPPRTGSIEVTNGVMTRSFQVQQASGCPLSVSQSTINFASPGGTGNVSVSAGGSCSWQGSTNAGWIQITSQPQSGDGTLVFTVLPNPTRIARSATIEIGTHVITVNQAPLRTVPFDFDGDARTDISVFRPSTGVWWVIPSGNPNNPAANQFGISTDKMVPADYDGDLKTDIAVYRDGVWYALRSSNGTVLVNTWGTATDLPAPGDFDADGSVELTVYRPSTGTWWILHPNNTFSSIPFGIAGDVPTLGDYDGDGKADISVYRPSTASGQSGTWWIIRSSNGSVAMHDFGTQGDIAVPSDYDGDGRDNVAVFRPSTGVWYRSLNAAQNYDAVQWGIAGDRLAPGDYDGDGKSDPAVVRIGGNAVWYLLGSTSGPQSVQFGITGDKPAPSSYLP